MSNEADNTVANVQPNEQTPAPAPAPSPEDPAKEAALKARQALEAEHAQLQHTYGGIALTLKALHEEEEQCLQKLKDLVTKIKAAM